MAMIGMQEPQKRTAPPTMGGVAPPTPAIDMSKYRSMPTMNQIRAGGTSQPPTGMPPSPFGASGGSRPQPLGQMPTPNQPYSGPLNMAYPGSTQMQTENQPPPGQMGGMGGDGRYAGVLEQLQRMSGMSPEQWQQNQQRLEQESWNKAMSGRGGGQPQPGTMGNPGQPSPTYPPMAGGQAGNQPSLPQWGTSGPDGSYGRKGAYQAGGADLGNGWTGMESANVRGVGVAGQEGNPYAGVDINKLPMSSEMRNAVGDARVLPSTWGGMMDNPSAGGAYGNSAETSRSYIDSLFNKPSGQPSEADFMNIGKDWLNSAQKGGPNMPTAPALGGAPSNTGPQGMGTSFDVNSMDLGKYPTEVNGPTLSDVNNPNGNFGGPNLKQYGLDELMQYAGQGAVGPLARESMGGGPTTGDPLAREAFRSAITGSSGGGGGASASDIDAAYNSMFAAAAKAGANKSGAKGFTDLKGTMAGKSMGEELGLAAARAAGEKAGLNLEAQKANMADRQQSMGNLISAGSSLGKYGTDISGQNLERDIASGSQNVTQRGQDVELQKYNASNGPNAGNVADLLRASTERELGGFKAGTERGGTMGDLSLKADELRRSGQLDSFRAGTERMDSLIKGVQAGNADAIAAYDAATKRGQVTGDLSKDAATLKYNYDVLNAEQAGNAEQRAIDLYGKQAGATTDAYGAETDRISKILAGAGGLAETAQGGDVKRRQQEIELGQLANDIISGKASATDMDNRIELAARQGDQEMVQRLIELKINLAQQSYMARKDSAMAGYGLLGDVVGAGASIAVAGMSGGGAKKPVPGGG